MISEVQVVISTGAGEKTPPRRTDRRFGWPPWQGRRFFIRFANNAGDLGEAEALSGGGWQRSRGILVGTSVSK